MSMITEKVTELRQGRNQVVGVFVGKLHKGKIIAGWSRVKPDSNDEFDMKKGIKFAIANGVENKDIPFRASMKDYATKYVSFRNRCLRYFEGFDFNGRTDKVYSKRGQARRGIVDPNDALITLVRGELDKMGVDKATVDSFIKASLPIVEILSVKGVQAVVLPLNMNAADYVKSAMGGMGLGSPVFVPVPVPA